MSTPDFALAGSASHAAPPDVLRERQVEAPLLGMRAKGRIALAFLFAYLGTMCALVVWNMNATLRSQEALAAQVRGIASVERVHAALEGASADAAKGLRVPGDLRTGQWRVALNDAAPAVPDAGGARDAARRSLAALDAGVHAWRGAPSDEQAGRVSRLLADATRDVGAAAREATLTWESDSAAFRRERRLGAGLMVGIGLLGIGLLGAAVVTFLSRMVADVGALMRRTSEIVAGQPPRPMPLTRFDELGQLSAAIGELAVALQRQERDLELERRKGFHREKMAAIGSLAAGVLTEIGNPLAAIDGMARAMREAPAADGPAAAHERATADAILEQTGRLMVVTQQIAEFAAPQPSRRELIDINGVVERALGLLRFDDAMRGIGIELALDRQLNAVPGTTDRLVQLMMNLIGNATDALHDRGGSRKELRIRTRQVDEDVVLEVADNGAGMTDDVRKRAFEPFFSTKPAGRGTGLGLPLCQSIVADHGGRIDIGSAAGVGTCVTIRLPLSAAEGTVDSGT